MNASSLEAAMHSVRMNASVLHAIEIATERARPRECCGLLLGARGELREAAAVRNEAVGDDEFQLDALGAAAVERAARVRGLSLMGYFHSHPSATAECSNGDQHGTLWSALWPHWHLIFAGLADWRLYRVDGAGWKPARAEVAAPELKS